MFLEKRFCCYSAGQLISVTDLLVVGQCSQIYVAVQRNIGCVHINLGQISPGYAESQEKRVLFAFITAPLVNCFKNGDWVPLGVVRREQFDI